MLNAEDVDYKETPDQGKILFLEEYEPFTMGEICGEFEESEALTGLTKMNEHKQDEMEAKYVENGMQI